MNRPLLLLALLALGAAPLAVAHVDGGVNGSPKRYCESLWGDTNVHDYAGADYMPPPAWVATGLNPYSRFPSSDGSDKDCDSDGVPDFWDGHREYAFGGATLLAGPPCLPDEGEHHPVEPDVWVTDNLFPSGVAFVVGADTTGICGDGFDDESTGMCYDFCSVDFPPGADGAYRVYVLGVVGTDVHTWDSALQPPPSTHPDHLWCEDVPQDVPIGNQRVSLCVHEFHGSSGGHVYTL